MSNPLDQLPFDINSLRTHDEFNWDCVDGIDQIHKDILKTWERIVINLTTPLNKINQSVLGVGESILSNATNQLQQVQDLVTQQDTTITNKLNTSLSPLVTSYGMPSSPSGYYLIYREMSCGTWIPVIEQWNVKPNGRPSYGPYSSWCALAHSAASGIGTRPHYEGIPPYDETYANNLDLMYKEAIQNGFEVDSKCSNNGFAGINLNILKEQVEQLQHCGTTSTSVSTSQQDQGYTELTDLTCEEFLNSQWVTNEAQDNLLLDVRQYSGLRPLYYNSNRQYLSRTTYNRLYNECNNPASSNGIPTSSILNNGTTDIPVPNTCTPCPSSTIQTPTLPLETIQQIQLIDNECCRQLIMSLEGIRINLSQLNNQQPITESLTALEDSNFSDEEYILSEQYLIDLNRSLNEHGTNYYQLNNLNNIKKSIQDLTRETQQIPPIFNKGQ